MASFTNSLKRMMVKHFFFDLPVEKTCTFEFENGPMKFSINFTDNEMKQLVGACVKAFGLKAVINAASEADDSDE